MNAHAVSPTMAAAADTELVVRALAGREDGFEELVRRYQRPIVAYVYRMVGDYDAELDLDLPHRAQRGHRPPAAAGRLAHRGDGGGGRGRLDLREASGEQVADARAGDGARRAPRGDRG